MCRIAPVVALLVASLLIGAAAQAQPAPEDQIKFRQSGFTFISWNMNRIKAQVVDREVEYQPEQVQRAADVIAAIANSGLSRLFGPGTDEGSGWKPTRLKSEFFDDLDRAGEIAQRFIEEANRLQEVAGTEDPDAIARQFNELAQACRSCHENYRAAE